MVSSINNYGNNEVPQNCRQDLSKTRRSYLDHRAASQRAEVILRLEYERPPGFVILHLRNFSP